MILRSLSWLRCTALVAALAFGVPSAALFSGCQSTGSSKFPAPAADWQSYTGQLFFRSAKGKSIIGDVVIRRSTHGDFQMEFLSGPGVPLMKLWKSASALRLEGILARGSWNVPVNHAPGPLRGWAGIPAVFDEAAASYKSSFTVGSDRVKAVYSSRNVSRLEVDSATGDRFVFQFSR